MKINLIKQSEGKLIGEIKLKFLPRLNDKIQYKGKEYSLISTTHNEDYINLFVSEIENFEKPNLSEPTIHSY